VHVKHVSDVIFYHLSTDICHYVIKMHIQICKISTFYFVFVNCF